MKASAARSVLSLILWVAVPAVVAGQSTAPAERQNKPAEVKKNNNHKGNPTNAAAEQQSGLNEAQATSLLRSKGYGNVASMHAEPNSIWIWQADTVKDGRRVRVGIDFRGNVVDISGGINQPCTSVGVRAGVAGMSVGSHLSQADACSTRATGG